MKTKSIMEEKVGLTIGRKQNLLLEKTKLRIPFVILVHQAKQFIPRKTKRLTNSMFFLRICF